MLKETLLVLSLGLNGLQQYSDIYFTIEKDNKAGINNKEYTYITYHVLVPLVELIAWNYYSKN